MMGVETEAFLGKTMSKPDRGSRENYKHTPWGIQSNTMEQQGRSKWHGRGSGVLVGTPAGRKKSHLVHPRKCGGPLPGGGLL